ncbi:MAG: histidinol dehydrogenase [Ignisphaera sp.]
MTVYRGLPSSRPLEIEKVLDVVKGIVDYVKSFGDKALIEFTKRFDGVEIDSVTLDRDQLNKCCRDLDTSIKNALNKVYDFLVKVHELCKPRDIIVEINGVKLGYVWRSIESVGIYVPGGRKAYPSTLLMAGVPAKVAKVNKLYVTSPPTPNGCLNPAVAYLSILLEVEEVYRIGGAHAIAALAYGTESVKKVQKIVGPGNIYVQAAKYLVQQVVAIDGIEGPTELVVIADDNADPKTIAVDMMAQAEHGYGSMVALISVSEEVTLEVSKILEQDTDHDYYVAVVDDVMKAIDIANSLAPEHLSLHIRDAHKYIPYIVNAGAVSISREPPALIDYIGPNHILPTNRWATSRGALSVFDFLKPVSVILDSSSMDSDLLKSVILIAEYEGFSVHGRSVGLRFKRSTR